MQKVLIDTMLTIIFLFCTMIPKCGLDTLLLNNNELYLNIRTYIRVVYVFMYVCIYMHT